MALCNGAITTRLGDGACVVGLFDATGQRRLHVKFSVKELPDFAYFNSEGRPMLEMGEPTER